MTSTSRPTTEIDNGHRLEWRPRRAPGIDAHTIKGEALLTGDNLAVPVLLNPIRTTLWSFLDGEVTVAQLADDLAAVLDAEIDQARGEVAELIARWFDLGLIQVEGAERQTDSGVLDGPQGVSKVLQSPAVAQPPRVANWIATHEPSKIDLRVGALEFAVVVETAELADAAAAHLGGWRIPSGRRWRWALVRERPPVTEGVPAVGVPGSLLLVSDIGLPFLRTDDPTTAVDAMVRHVSHLADLQSSSAAWFRTVTLLHGSTAVLIQPEFLHSYPGLADGLAQRGWRIDQTQHSAVDPVTGDVLVFPTRPADGPSRGHEVAPPLEPDRFRCAGVILATGAGGCPLPETEGMRVWLLTLFATIGLEPRCDPIRRRLDAAATISRRRLEITESLAADALLAALDRVAPTG